MALYGSQIRATSEPRAFGSKLVVPGLGTAMRGGLRPLLRAEGFSWTDRLFCG